MYWYLTVTHISDCEINSVALNHCRVLSNLKHSNLTLWLIIHSLIARYTRIQLMIILHNVALSCFKSYIQNKHKQIHSHNEPTKRNASDRDDERGKILTTIRRNVLLWHNCETYGFY